MCIALKPKIFDKTNFWLKKGRPGKGMKVALFLKKINIFQNFGRHYSKMLSIGYFGF